MDTIRLCKSCRQPLAGKTPNGLCPQCVTAANLGGKPASSETRIPPEATELASYFPQLEMIDLLGMGGMGIVYKARQPQLDRLVALKILPLDSAKDLSFAERFSREARALAKLNHPGIVAVYEFGQTGPYCYFLMEFVDGMNLRQLLDSQTVTPRQTLEWVMQICAALQFAHDEGVIHRDIKPANILVTKKGQPKIADFGLVKLMGDTPEPKLTASHDAMGTLNYMAPEQRENAQAVDRRADIFSLGVMFYEMLTGEVPMGRFEPPSKKAQVDARLDEVVLRALEREPARRYQQASELKSGVEAITQAAAKTARPRVPTRQLRPWQSAALLCIPLLALAILLRLNSQAVWDFFFPPNANEWVRRAEVLLERYDLPGHVESAISDLQQAVLLNPNLTEAYENLGMAYWRSYCRSVSSEALGEAWSASSKALAHNSRSVNALLVQGLVEEKEKRLNEARDSLIRANEIKEWENAEVLIGLAKVYAELKDKTNSLLCYSNALKAGIKKKRPWYVFKSIGHFEFKFLNDIPAAILSYQAATNATPDNAIALASLGGVFLYTSNHDIEGLECLKASLKLGPTEDAYNILGVYELDNRQWSAAARNFDAAAKLNLERPDFTGNEGLALVHLKEHREEGRELLRKALLKAQAQIKDTQDSLTAANRGLYEAGLGDDKAAYATLSHEIEKSPNISEVVANIDEAADLLDEVYWKTNESAQLRRLIPAKYNHQ